MTSKGAQDHGPLWPVLAFTIVNGLNLGIVRKPTIPFKEARNSFVGRAQTGFQFSRETQKLKQTNKNGVALSSGFNILRWSFKSFL